MSTAPRVTFSEGCVFAEGIEFAVAVARSGFVSTQSREAPGETAHLPSLVKLTNSKFAGMPPLLVFRYLHLQPALCLSARMQERLAHALQPLRMQWDADDTGFAIVLHL